MLNGSVMSEFRHLHGVLSGGALVVLRSCVLCLLLLPRFDFLLLITRALPSILLNNVSSFLRRCV